MISYKHTHLGVQSVHDLLQHLSVLPIKAGLHFLWHKCSDVSDKLKAVKLNPCEQEVEQKLDLNMHSTVCSGKCLLIKCLKGGGALTPISAHGKRLYYLFTLRQSSLL